MSSTTQLQPLLPIIRSQFSKLKIPGSFDKVYKDECVYSFDSPFSDDGLFLNLYNFHGVGFDYLEYDSKKTNCKLYLLLKWRQVPRTEETNTSTTSSNPTKLALGVEGGFQTEETKFDIEKEHFLVVITSDSPTLTYSTIALPNQDLPEFVSNVLQGIINHEGMKLAMQTAAAWDADSEPKIVSKYAENLIQINPENKRIPQDPKSWKDEASDATDNLWLNLSTGYIGGGRRNWDGTGGSGSALQHYLDTGRKYPLVVKLGTITAHSADVYSYAEDEDCMVIDPKLPDHLSFWGIDIMKLEKTEMTVSEMEVKLNMSYDWGKIMEGQEEMVILSGPGYNGLQNIGSSCYFNSLVQVFAHIPEIAERYYQHRPRILLNYQEQSPVEDFSIQFSKLLHGLLTDRYSPPGVSNTTAAVSVHEEKTDSTTLEKYLLAPRMLKQLIGKNHPDFSSSKQQDVAEFFLHWLDRMNQYELQNLPKFTPAEATRRLTSSLFEFHLEMKYRSLQTNHVKFNQRRDQTLTYMLELPIPLEKAVILSTAESSTEREESKEREKKRARMEDDTSDLHSPVENTTTTSSPVVIERRVAFEDCLEEYFKDDFVTMEHEVLQNPRAQFRRTTRLRTFPRYLVVKLNRYTLTSNWTVQKITAEVPMPDQLDLSAYTAVGLQADEEEITTTNNNTNNTSNTTTNNSNAVVEADEGLVTQLISMGFSENGCRRAAIATKNADIEVAMNYILEHMEDPDFDSPIEVAANTTIRAEQTTDTGVNEEAVMMIVSMGYTVEHARAALLANQQDIERAMDWIFSQGDALQDAVEAVLNASTTESTSSTTDTPQELESGEGKYTLIAVISHIGKNTDHGHYICHLRNSQDGSWALYNDEKVGKSVKPPLGHGYVYIYKRDDSPGHW